jgi:hypothetical protein
MILWFVATALGRDLDGTPLGRAVDPVADGCVGPVCFAHTELDGLSAVRHIDVCGGRVAAVTWTLDLPPPDAAAFAKWVHHQARTADAAEVGTVLLGAAEPGCDPSPENTPAPHLVAYDDAIVGLDDALTALYTELVADYDQPDTALIVPAGARDPDVRALLATQLLPYGVLARAQWVDWDGHAFTGALFFFRSGDRWRLVTQAIDQPARSLLDGPPPVAYTAARLTAASHVPPQFEPLRHAFLDVAGGVANDCEGLGWLVPDDDPRFAGGERRWLDARLADKTALCAVSARLAAAQRVDITDISVGYVDDPNAERPGKRLAVTLDRENVVVLRPGAL